MKEELFNSEKVNPRWLKQHVVWLFNRIYDILNDENEGRLNENEMLIQALIEFEWYRYKIPDDWLGIVPETTRKIPKRKQK